MKIHKVLKNNILTSSYKNIKLILRLLMVILLILIFILFRFLNSLENKKVSTNISAVLRNELSASNSYALSKTLVDLENLGVFKCARLTEELDSKRVFYDTVLGKRCGTYFANNFLSYTDHLKGLNGTSYKLDYIAYFNVYAFILEIFLYLIMISLGIFLPNFYMELIEVEKVRNAVLKLENESFSDFAKQISHDVASPLSVIRMMTSLIRNVDPEVKDVLEKSISRTQEIFNELKLTSYDGDRLEDVNICSCISDIMQEKVATWPKSAKIGFSKNVVENVLIKASKNNFKKIISNILNNSFESLPLDAAVNFEIVVTQLGEEKILIKLKDNGKGMSPEVLKRVGSKNFSFEKPDSDSGARGFGLYHATELISRWGGQIAIESQLNIGSVVCITLPCEVSKK